MKTGGHVLIFIFIITLQMYVDEPESEMTWWTVYSYGDKDCLCVLRNCISSLLWMRTVHSSCDFKSESTERGGLKVRRSAHLWALPSSMQRALVTGDGDRGRWRWRLGEARSPSHSRPSSQASESHTDQCWAKSNLAEAPMGSKGARRRRPPHYGV